MSFMITPIERRDKTSPFRQSYTAYYVHHNSGVILGYEIYDQEVRKDWVFISALDLKPTALERITEDLEDELARQRNKTISLDSNEIA